MPSPESRLRFNPLYAPDNAGVQSNGPLSSPEPPQPSETHQALQAIGLAAHAIVKGRKQIELPIEEIEAGYNHGLPVSELAERYGVSKRTIYNRLHEVGQPGRRSPNLKERNPEDLLESESGQQSTEYSRQSSAGDTPKASHRQRQLEAYLKRKARWRSHAEELGLSEDASWDEIIAREDRNKRKTVTQRLNMGLAPEEAEQFEKAGDDPYPGWEIILYYALNLKATPYDEFPVEEIVRRTKEARKLFRKLDKQKQKKR